jgi:ankyrin repeat protein
VVNHAGMGPFHDVAAEGQTACLSLLLNRSCRKDLRDKSGWTPLDWATNNNRILCAQVLGGEPSPKPSASEKTDPNQGPRSLSSSAFNSFLRLIRRGPAATTELEGDADEISRGVWNSLRSHS